MKFKENQNYIIYVNIIIFCLYVLLTIRDVVFKHPEDYNPTYPELSIFLFMSIHIIVLFILITIYYFKKNEEKAMKYILAIVYIILIGLPLCVNFGKIIGK